MKSFQQLAQSAYEAHMAESGRQHNNPAPISWKALPPAVQACWVKAVQAVVADLQSIQ